MKATAIAPSNIALTKYWGKKDEVLRLPENGSISITLSNLLTTTTVEFDPSYRKDQIIINEHGQEKEVSRVVRHLDRIRKYADSNLFAKVISENNFPTASGLSSSASGFAALTVAATVALGLKLSEKNLSILARQGSGTACRSIPGGFVEWLDGDTSETSYAKTIFPPNHWDLTSVVGVVSQARKEVSTSEGHDLVYTSPFYQVRLSKMKSKNLHLKKLIKQKSFTEFGELIEEDAIELHIIMLSSKPSLIYWYPGTIAIMRAVRAWRSEGLEAYFTMNTGHDIHIICQNKDYKKVVTKLKELKVTKQIIVNFPSEGTKLSTQHLF
jgi:diphosphomevalonate decarboxylase